MPQDQSPSQLSSQANISARRAGRAWIVPLLYIGLPPLVCIAAGEHSWLGASLVLSAVLLWLTEALPLPITALLVPSLACVYGVQAAEEAFRPFGSPILFLLIGSFLMARAMQKHALDRRIAFIVLSRRLASGSIEATVLVLTLLVWVTGMWMSNTVACAIFLPIFVAVADSYQSKLEEEDAKRLTARLLLTCAFVPSIGGLCTPVGSVPNAISLTLLAREGMTIHFGQWMMRALPVSLAVLCACYLILRSVFPARGAGAHGQPEAWKRELAALGPVRRAEIQVFLCFCLAVALWLLPDIVRAISPETEAELRLAQRLNPGAVALAIACLLFVLPSSSLESNLDWSDGRTIDWGTVLLFGGGLCVGGLLDSTGLAQAAARMLSDLARGEWLLTAVAAVAVTVALSEVASNTASASLIIPVVISIAGALEPAVGSKMVFAASLAASFGYMLPISTPPNAMVFGTGRISSRSFLIAGALLDLAALTLVVVIVLVLA